MIYMLDTNIISYLIRGSSLALKNRFEKEDPENLAISTVVYAELLYGLERINGKKIAAKIKSFLDKIRLADFDANAAAAYARIRAGTEKSGISLDNMDLLIAAAAIAEKAVLVSHNVKHFSKIKELKTEDWY